MSSTLEIVRSAWSEPCPGHRLRRVLPTAGLLLSLVSLAAAFIPALRATRIDPVAALKT